MDKQLLKKAILLLPLILCLVSFILTSLALFAGNKKGFMEDYAVIRLNTSMIGENVILSSKSSSSGGNSDGDSALDGLRNKWSQLEGAGKGKIGDIAGNVIGNVADDIGVAEWYSLHILNACQGSFGANATASHFKLNVTSCTHSSPRYRFNLTEVLNHELSLGPFHVSLADIDWPDSIQSSVSSLNNVLMALFVFYVLGVGFSGLGMFGCAPAFLFPEKKYVIIINLINATLAAACITLGSIVATAASAIGASAINGDGKKIGVIAEKGVKFYTITWIAAGFMSTVTFYWAAQFWLLKRRQQKDAEMYAKEVY